MRAEKSLNSPFELYFSMLPFWSVAKNSQRRYWKDMLHTITCTFDLTDHSSLREDHWLEHWSWFHCNSDDHIHQQGVWWNSRVLVFHHHCPIHYYLSIHNVIQCVICILYPSAELSWDLRRKTNGLDQSLWLANTRKNMQSYQTCTRPFLCLPLLFCIPVMG